MQVLVDLSSENINWHLSQLMVLEYGCALFTDRGEASRWYMTVAAFPMPPVAEKTNGVKSHALLLSLLPCIFSSSHSYASNTASGVELVLVGTKELKTLTSRNALSSLSPQKPCAQMSRRAPSSVLAVLCLSLSPESGIRDGSKATPSWHTSQRRQAVVSLMSL